MDNGAVKRGRQPTESPDKGNSQSKDVTKKRKQGEEYICPICTDIIIENTKEVDGHDAIFCEGTCNSWLHRQCAEQRVKTLETKNSTNANISYASATASSISSQPIPAPPSSVTSPPNDHITTTVSSYLNEEKEKSKRRLNLIVHNLKEPSSEDGATRKKEDIKQINDLLQKHVEVTPSITNAIKLGKRGDRPRLLRITVSTESEKANVLRNTFKLRREQETKNIFISPDMTPREQELNKKLRLDVKELNEDGNRYQIKNGKIVQRKGQF
ncbi:uncharacterized protein [Dysidea avara]|uniref:uncharacterized protein n=1 Tax=Dysidea avara TaxID=196820 RepID=UPI003316FF64